MSRPVGPPGLRRTVGLLILAALLVTAGCTRGANPPAPTPGGVSPDERQVWAHVVSQGLPDRAEAAGTEPYGSNFPLDLEPAGSSAPVHDVPGSIERAKAAGLTGMQLLQIEGVNSGTDFVAEWQQAADRAGDLVVAPCLQVSSRAGAQQMIEQYLSVARAHKSAAKVDGRYVIYVYGGRSLSPDDWRSIHQAIDATGTGIYLVGDLQPESSQHNDQLDAALVSPYLTAFDAVWIFDDHADAIAPAVAQLAAGAGVPFVGGMIPGYDRRTPGGGYADAEGTALFRRQWQRELDRGPDWVNVVTWSDFVERSEIQPTSDWSVTRSDINAFYSAKLRGETLPQRSAQAYLTTPKFVATGQPLAVEGLVLNGSDEPATLSVQLRDGSGQAVGGPVSLPVDADASGSVTVDLPTGHTASAGTWLRAEARLTDPSGRVLQEFSSAPVGITPATQPWTGQRRDYYSVAGRSAMPTAPTLEVTGDPRTASGSSATVTSGDQARLIDVLQNGQQVSLGTAERTWSTRIPMGSRRVVGGEEQVSTAAGFYVGRVIDAQGRVGYTDPRYFG